MLKIGLHLWGRLVADFDPETMTFGKWTRVEKKVLNGVYYAKHGCPCLCYANKGKLFLVLGGAQFEIHDEMQSFISGGTERELSVKVDGAEVINWRYTRIWPYPDFWGDVDEVDEDFGLLVHDLVNNKQSRQKQIEWWSREGE
jgi:hypothetical protein